MLLFAIGFNLWLYRLEPTALVDPNDNTFQFALVYRTNQIWDFAQQNCSGIGKPVCMLTYLTDHWVPNWAQGYNLPHYYSHVPQIVIVATYRMLDSLIRLFGYSFMSLFEYYHWLTYILLSVFPVSMYAALAVIGMSPLTAGFGALIATHLSTDGLYGLDPTSFLWRGYGLSSQLYAMLFLPLAIAYSWRFFAENSNYNIRNVSRFGISELFGIRNLNFGALPVILTLAATTAGHLGIGIIAFLSIAVISLNNVRHLRHLSDVIKPIKILCFIFGGVFLLLGYWIIPIFLYGDFHNNSVWDPVWKFDSYGFKPVLTNLFNGALFDFGRVPVLTALVFAGLFASLFNIQYSAFSILFIFWLLMYFGTTTWGSLLYLIPGMKDFHLSRFIVGVHIAGLFLIPLSIDYLKKYKFVPFVLLVPLVLLVFPQTIRYAAHNDRLILQANENYTKQAPDADLLITTLNQYMEEKPGRVFAGRGGTWGKDLMIAETPYYMHLSTYGLPTVLWLPETWSPNSDTEQYFREDKISDYILYNIRYVVTIPDLPDAQIQPFWKQLMASESWILYEVNTEGYVTTGVRPAVVSVSKDNFLNIVRLWIQSEAHNNALYPKLTFDSGYPINEGLPNFRMTDEVTYRVPDGSLNSLLSEVPGYVSTLSDLSILGNLKIVSQSQDIDQVFRATVDVPENCTECIAVLRHTFHPSWKATVDGEPAETFAVFPFYTAVRLDSPGVHDIEFSYQPSDLKILLLLVSIASLGILIWLARPNSLQKIKAKL